ncbi:MAG: hypothetical protein ACTSRK_10285 [Promethearchaeota archaeon]
MPLKMVWLAFLSPLASSPICYFLCLNYKVINSIIGIIGIIGIIV